MSKVFTKFISTTLLLISLSACSTWQIAHYDTTTDNMVTQLQQQMDMIFVDIATNMNNSKSDYTYFITRYEKINSALLVLTTRVKAIDHNKITTTQISLLTKSIKLFQRQHKRGLHNSAELHRLQSLINGHFYSILKLELAKPR